MTALATVAERAPRGRSLIISAVGLTLVLWASAFVAIRYADRELSPGALALGRLLVGSLALGLLVLVRHEPLPGRRQLGGIAVCGVLWFGLYNVSLNAAEAAFAYAGGVVAQKPVLRHASPLMVTWLACTIGAASCLPTLEHSSARSATPGPRRSPGRSIWGWRRPRSGSSHGLTPWPARPRGGWA